MVQTAQSIDYLAPYRKCLLPRKADQHQVAPEKKVVQKGSGKPFQQQMCLSEQTLLQSPSPLLAFNRGPSQGYEAIADFPGQSTLGPLPSRELAGCR